MRSVWVFSMALVLASCKREAPLPEPPAIDAAATVQLDVDLRAGGAMELNGAPVADDNALAALVRELTRDKPAAHAILYVEKDVPYDRVIATESALKRGGVAHISFGVHGVRDASSL